MLSSIKGQIRKVVIFRSAPMEIFYNTYNLIRSELPEACVGVIVQKCMVEKIKKMDVSHVFEIQDGFFDLNASRDGLVEEVIDFSPDMFVILYNSPGALTYRQIEEFAMLSGSRYMMTVDPSNNVKIYPRQEWIKNKENSCIPTSINIEITTKCNLKCKYCSRRLWNAEEINMTFEQFKYVVDKFEGLGEVNLTGGGESLLNPDFIKMVEYLKQKRIASQFTTNGSIMTEMIAKKLISSEMRLVAFSFDTADKYLFEELRPGLKFEKFIQNVSLLSKMKKTLGSSTPTLSAFCVVSEKNYQKLDEFVELARELGIEHVSFTKFFNFEQKNLVNSIPDSKIYLVENAAKKARGYNIKAYLWNFRKEPITKCYFPWKGACITLNGNYHICCYTVVYGRLWDKKFSFGNVFRQSIKDIVNREELSKIKQEISQGQVPPLCSNCPQFGT